MKTFKQTIQELEKDIQDSYENGVSPDEAEKLAGKFLKAQIIISSELTNADRDARMRKSGLKAIKAAAYLAEVQRADKKPSDTYLEQVINTNTIVVNEQDQLDKAEIEYAELSRLLQIFNNAHIHYRGIAKGTFGG